MAARLRKNIATIFDVFCEVGMSGQRLPAILQKYPDDFADESVLKSIRLFTFPCGIDDTNAQQMSDAAVQLFSFVLTDAQSCYTMCRYFWTHIFSALPWTTFFYKLLNHLATVMNNGSTEEVEALLTRAYHTEIPNSGDTFMIESSLGRNKLEIIAPYLDRLPTLLDDKYMLEFLNALSEKHMIAIYASLLKERRILFTGRKLSQLSGCVFAASTLIFPMHWQSIFIPVLPEHLKETIMAPMPFLIGIPKKTLQQLPAEHLSDLVVVDLDCKTLTSPYNDLEQLPTEVYHVLRSQLRSSADMICSDGLSRSFLRATVVLFGAYRVGFVRSTDDAGLVVWNKDRFIRGQRPSLQPFLSLLLGTDGVQYLERFIDERREALNAGRSIDDEFERELSWLESRPQLVNTSHHIQQAVTSVRGNASDVYEAMKGRFQDFTKDFSSINNAEKKDNKLKEKFGRFTPKESRRKKAMQSRATEFGVPALESLSIAVSEPEASNGERRPSPFTDDRRRHVGDMCKTLSRSDICLNKIDTVPSPPSTAAIIDHHADLIDWGVDTNNHIELDPFSARSKPLGKSMSTSAVVQQQSNVDLLTMMQVDQSRRNWEQFGDS